MIVYVVIYEDPWEDTSTIAGIFPDLAAAEFYARRLHVPSNVQIQKHRVGLPTHTPPVEPDTTWQMVRSEGDDNTYFFQKPHKP